MRADGHPSSWETIAVVDEMSYYDRSFWRKIDPRLVPHNSKLWGPSYFYDAEQPYSINEKECVSIKCAALG